MIKLPEFLLHKHAIACAENSQLGVASVACENIDFREEEDGKLLKEMQIVTTSGFGVPVEGKVLENPNNIFLGADTLFLLHDGSALLGFATAHIRLLDLLYIHGMVTSELVRGRGGAKLLLQGMLGLSTCSDAFLETQNPVIFCLMRAICERMYPSPAHEKIPRRLVARIAKLEGRGDFPSINGAGVMQNLYSRCLYKRIPESRDAQVNEWFKRRLRIKNGITRNGMFLVGEGLKR